MITNNIALNMQSESQHVVGINADTDHDGMFRALLNIPRIGIFLGDRTIREDAKGIVGLC